MHPWIPTQKFYYTKYWHFGSSIAVFIIKFLCQNSGIHSIVCTVWLWWTHLASTSWIAIQFVQGKWISRTQAEAEANANANLANERKVASSLRTAYKILEVILRLPPKIVEKPFEINNNPSYLPLTHCRKQRSMFCMQAVHILPMSSYSSKLQWNFDCLFINHAVNQWLFTEKVLLKSLKVYWTEPNSKANKKALRWGSSLLFIPEGMCMCTAYQPSCVVV